jgi:branched-chain amino acid transport system permease protein
MDSLRRALGRLPLPAQERLLRPVGFIGAGVVALLVPQLFQVPGFADSLNGVGINLGLLADATVFTLLALGLNIVVGLSGLLDLGYAAFFAIGAYTYGELASQFFNIHLAFVPLLLLAAVVAASFGVLLGAPTLRLRGDYLAIVTLGFGEIVPRVIRNAQKLTGGVNGISAIDRPKIEAGPLHIIFGFDPIPYYYTILVVVLVSVVLIRNLQHSRLGRAWQAIREDELAAQAMGINTVTTKLLAFAMGASFSGFAGCFYGSKVGLISPETFDFQVSVTVLAMVVLGGMGNITGVIVGSYLIYMIENWFLPHLPQLVQLVSQSTGTSVLTEIHYSDYTYVLLGILLIAFMLLRPQGLIPSRLRRAELREGGIEGALGGEVETVAPGEESSL